ncbi:hypothetical protein L1987_15109 [Smallanthus sonchifolius]|uniref:Uncharacterized protein n=1 Tax=Smallanthus sonchifolius TaxID=185202 RepID=A0ACB9J860_9ASTR|nr:hypothetical protein L1987_15109 [Smallanthus sonchifolius]
MPPRRDNSNNSNNTDLAALLTQLVNQITQANNNTNGHASGSANTGGGGGANPPQCTFKHFNSCNPLKFYGSEGATGLLQWFESIESTFLNSDCPDNLRVCHATSVFQKRALTWWNGEKRTRGMDVAMALPWDELKRIMTEEFCPRNEMKKLEAEFWDLAQDSGESLAYTTRFHELSLLVPHMVTPLSRCIEKYIGGLPRQIQDTVVGGNPATLEDAIRLSATLTDNHVKAGTLIRKGAKKVSDTTTPPAHVKEVQTEPYRNTRKRKVKNCAVITPAAPVNQVAPMTQNPQRNPMGTATHFATPATIITLQAYLVVFATTAGNMATQPIFVEPRHLPTKPTQQIKPIIKQLTKPSQPLQMDVLASNVATRTTSVTSAQDWSMLTKAELVGVLSISTPMRLRPTLMWLMVRSL